MNLPEKHRSRWGEGLTAEDMKKCVWLRPGLVAQIEFLEWTESDHLGHSKFVGLREDKDPKSVVKNFCSLLHGEMSSFKVFPRVVKESSHFPVALNEAARATSSKPPSEKVFLSEHIGLRLRVLL